MGLALDLARALDPVRFAPAIGMVPDAWQARVLRSSSDRLLLNCCRQSGKSTTAALLAVWTAVYEPGSLILLLSPSLRQSTELFKKSLVIYRALGRPVLAETENLLSIQLENSSRLLSLPSSESTVRGYSGVRLLIVDEASRVEDALYASLRPTLAVSSGRILAMSTPHGARGWWWEAWTNGGPVWERYQVTAPDVPRISPAFLREERAVIGEWLWKQEYFGEFVSPIDAIFDSGAVDAAFRDDIEPLNLDWR
jgi:terminase large subunit-like protein